MSATLITIGAIGIEYVRSNLLGGLSLARASIRGLGEWSAVALVPGGTTTERAQDLKAGGLGRSTIDDLVSILVEKYPGANLIVELPLWRPSDPGVIAGDHGVVVCDSDVFAIARLSGPRDAISRALRIADPAFMHNAFVVSYPKGSSESRCNAA